MSIVKTIPKSTIFGSAAWFSKLSIEQQKITDLIDNFGKKAKRQHPANDVSYHVNQELYDWVFGEINNKKHTWESMYIPMIFQVEEKSEGDPYDCLTLYYTYGDNEEHAFLKIHLLA